KQGLESTYGAAASIVVLLIWVYYSSQLVLMGAEFTRVYARRRALVNASADRRPIEPQSQGADQLRPCGRQAKPLRRRRHGIASRMVVRPLWRPQSAHWANKLVRYSCQSHLSLMSAELFRPHLVSRQRIPSKGLVMATRSNVRSVVSDAQDKGREAVEAVSEVRDNVAVAIDKSLKKRPYTTLGLTLALGFLLGAMWAR